VFCIELKVRKWSAIYTEVRPMELSFCIEGGACHVLFEVGVGCLDFGKMIQFMKLTSYQYELMAYLEKLERIS